MKPGNTGITRLVKAFDYSMQGFAAASGFLRRQLASRLRLKYMPDLIFHLDDSIERGAEVIRLIERISSSSTEQNEH